MLITVHYKQSLTTLNKERKHKDKNGDLKLFIIELLLLCYVLHRISIYLLKYLQYLLSYGFDKDVGNQKRKIIYKLFLIELCFFL